MMLSNDFRFALRRFRKDPGFTLLVLATLGLTIGANTAVYSILDAVLFRAVPYPQADRLAILEASYSFNGDHEEGQQTGAQFLLVRASVPALDIAAYSRAGGANFASGSRPEYIQQQRVSAGFFRVLGIQPQYGREFTRAEDVPGGPALAVLSYHLWQRVFKSNAEAVGRTITLRGEPYIVVGVMPQSFQTPERVDVWTSLRPSPNGEGSGANYGAIARLKAGVSLAQAEVQLAAASRAIETAHHLNGPAQSRFGERLVPYQQGMTGSMREEGSIRTELLVTWGAVLIVLFIGCINIAGLLLARSRIRRLEIATRMAVGGSRGCIIRQLLVESLLLALGGFGAGLITGSLALSGLKRMGASSFELWRPIALDGRVLLAMLGLAVGTVVVFGVVPAISTTHVDIRSVLVEGGRGKAGGHRQWSRALLIVGEFALSLVLLISAGLLIRTLSYLHRINPGFDSRHLIAAEASLQDKRYENSAAVSRLFRETLNAIGRIPGVESTAVALTLPYELPLNQGFQIVDGNDRRGHIGEWVYTTPGYFKVMGIPIERGREFRTSDTPQAAGVLVVSHSFAARYLPGQDPIGHHIACGNATCEIVGVAGDVPQHSGLTSAGGPISIEPTIYIPAAQMSDPFVALIHTWFSPKWVVRTNKLVVGIEPAVRNAIESVDPLLPVAHFRSMGEIRGRYIADQQYLAMLFSVFAGLSVLLAAIGLCGLIARTVAERQHEIGVRLALGASVQRIVLDVMKPGILFGVAGVALGTGLSLGAVHLLKSMIWGLQPTDPSTFIGTAAILLAVTALGSFIPALRILRLDPAKTLRSE